MNLQEATANWRQDKPFFEERGMTWADGWSGPQTYRPDEWKRNFHLAMDAQPGLITDPTAGIPALLTTSIDPEVTRILFTPNKAAEIFGEKRAGTWVDQTRMFPVVEHTGEVSSYGDFATSGHANVNADWPNRQAYLFQTIKQYGELELERAGLAKLNWVSEIDQSAATILNKFLNYTYFFGVASLQNYGLLNDPNLNASITPAPKAYGGTKWIVSNVVQATANEVFTDIQSMVSVLINQTNGLVDANSKYVLALSPQSELALTATNSFNVNVHTLLKTNFPNLKVMNAIQYGVITSSNPQGLAAGNFAQLIVEDIEGQDTGYTSFNEKQRSHPIIKDMSSFKQKLTAGSWGTIIRIPAAISSMIGL